MPRSNRPQKQTFASRLFGHDIFLSFALGGGYRGTQSYTSDLARRLRERDFTVFFSEDEAAPGSQLDSTLRNALLRSRILVVIANHGTLREPRWVWEWWRGMRLIPPDKMPNGRTRMRNVQGPFDNGQILSTT